jgi:hypothetical protein
VILDDLLLMGIGALAALIVREVIAVIRDTRPDKADISAVLRKGRR